jgi:RNA-directed DNA polymerase
MRWICTKYAGRHRVGMTELRRRFCDQGWRFASNGVVFTGASSVAVTRYRYRSSKIPTPWTPPPVKATASRPASSPAHPRPPGHREHARPSRQ